MGAWIFEKSDSSRSANKTISRIAQLRQSEVPRQAEAVLMGITVVTPFVYVAG
jgi:hypothetical protein